MEMNESDSASFNSSSADPSSENSVPPAASEDGASPATVPATGESTPPAPGTAYTLTATNASTVSGNQYFNVFPPCMTVKPAQRQRLLALVSSPTVTGEGAAAQATLTWQAGPDTLALFALTPKQSPDGAPRTPVALGDTATVTWDGGAFTIATSANGTPGAITVTFNAGIPVGSQVGLVVGPGSILVSAPTSASTMTLVPDLSPTVTVQFGTPFDPGSPGVTDVSQTATVIFAGPAASITIGPDNQIQQTA